MAVGRKSVYSEGKPASFCRAANEVNNLKRPLKSGSHELPTIEDFETVPSPPSSHVTPEAAKSTSHSSQPATTKQVSTPSRSQMELPLRAGTTRRTALSGSEGLELSGADCGDERSDYELQRARSIRLNKEFLHSQQMCNRNASHAGANYDDTSGKCIRCLNAFVFTMLSEENGYSLHRITSLFEFLAVIEVQNRCVKLYDSVFESIQGNAITVLRNFLLQEQSQQRSFRTSDDPWVFSNHKAGYTVLTPRPRVKRECGSTTLETTLDAFCERSFNLLDATNAAI
ncbi:hypothetical protein EMCRGX_G027421 [Ephydatia muelleri]